MKYNLLQFIFMEKLCKKIEKNKFFLGSRGAQRVREMGCFAMHFCVCKANLSLKPLWLLVQLRQLISCQIS